MITICAKIPLPGNHSQSFSGIAFDGCQYYLSSKFKNEITILDNDFNTIECAGTRRPYTALCYDPLEQCFWAVSKQSANVLFKLNRSLQEFDRIDVHTDCRCSGTFTGISYCCEEDRLLVSAADCLLLIDKYGRGSNLPIRSCDPKQITGVLCIAPCICYVTKMKSECTLSIISWDGEIIERVRIPFDFQYETAILHPCRDQHGRYHIYLLACKQNRSPYIFDIRLDQHLSNMFSRCNEALCQDCCCDLPRDCGHDCDCNQDCDCEHDCDCGHDCDCDCDYDHDCDCHQDCDCGHDCDCSNDCGCHQDCGNHNCERGCCSILESIALQEAALAHILNAEGEKLQKAIADNATICELIELNESVHKSIIHVTHMEQVLFAKLDVLNKCCNFCGKSPCPPPCSCDGCTE